VHRHRDEVALFAVGRSGDLRRRVTASQQAIGLEALFAQLAAARLEIRAIVLNLFRFTERQRLDMASREAVGHMKQHERGAAQPREPPDMLENAVEQYTYTGVVRKRAGSRHGTAWPCTVLPCKDGYVGMCCTQLKEVRGAVLLAEDEELANDPVLENQFERRARADELEPRLVAGYMKYGKAELFHRGQALGCPIGMTSDARDLATDPHLNEVGFFAEFDK